MKFQGKSLMPGKILETALAGHRTGSSCGQLPREVKGSSGVITGRGAVGRNWRNLYYTLWIAADDMCELWHSTDFDPANRVRIANHNNWTERYDWDKNETQESVPVTLEAGEIYYIEAIFKEHEGGDNCAVAWQGPGIPNRVVIPGSYLSPVHDGQCSSIAYHVSGLSEQVQRGTRLEISFAGQPADAGDLPCGSSGDNQYVFNHNTDVDQEMIAGIHLNYFGARYYDAEVGLWTSTDPVHEFWNAYSYTGANPVNLIDPWGLLTQEEANRMTFNEALDRLEAEQKAGPTNRQTETRADQPQGTQNQQAPAAGRSPAAHPDFTSGST